MGFFFAMNFLQINTNRSVPSLDLARAKAAEVGAQVILASELNRRAAVGSNWFRDLNSDAVIGIVDSTLHAEATGSGRGFV